jgi:hypothetical protein
LCWDEDAGAELADAAVALVVVEWLPDLPLEPHPAIAAPATAMAATAPIERFRACI